ncbi:MAG TPA: hypothetical protein PKY50_10280 [Candidatus Competibacter sp.]|nr:hypothetical protein [Candidatus Competibacter sp.]
MEKYGMSKIFSLILGLLISLSPCVSAEKHENREQPIKLMIGWNFPNSPGVQIFSPPKKNKYYHVLAGSGETAYIGKTLEKLEDDLCLGKKKKNWYVLPGNGSVRLDRIPSAAIVVESSVRIDLKPVAVKPLDLDQKRLSNYAREIAEAEKLTGFAYAIRNTGYKKEAGRAAIILSSKEDRDQSNRVDRIVISVVDIVGDNVRERYRYRKSRGDSGDLIANLAAVADIDRDGLADVLLLDQGDFQGKMLLIETGNVWREQRDDWGEPC